MYSLGQRSDKNFLITKRNAGDQRCLKILFNDESIAHEVKISKVLKTLWEVCTIPDYSKDLDEFHSRFLKKVFFFLLKEKSILKHG